MKRFLDPLVRRLGVNVIVTDGLASFRLVADLLGLAHQVCRFPVRRSGQSQPLLPLRRLRAVLLRLSEHWPAYRVFERDKAVSWTDNGSERAVAP